MNTPLEGHLTKVEMDKKEVKKLMQAAYKLFYDYLVISGLLFLSILVAMLVFQENILEAIENVSNSFYNKYMIAVSIIYFILLLLKSTLLANFKPTSNKLIVKNNKLILLLSEINKALFVFYIFTCLFKYQVPIEWLQSFKGKLIFLEVWSFLSIALYIMLLAPTGDHEHNDKAVSCTLFTVVVFLLAQLFIPEHHFTNFYNGFRNFFL